MPQLFNAASGIINAFMQGAMLKRQMEQDALAKEQWTEEQKLKSDREKEQQRQFDEAQKLRREIETNEVNYRKKQLELDEIRSKQQQSLLGIQLAREKNDKLKDWSMYGNVPTSGVDLNQINTLLSQQFTPASATPGAIERNLLPDVDTATYAGEDVGKGIPGLEGGAGVISPGEMRAAKGVYTRGEQVKRQQEIQARRDAELARLRELEIQKRAEANQARTDAMLAKIGSDRDRETVNEEGLESLLQQGMSGGINIDRLGTKTRERLMVEAGKRGIYLQPEKFKEDSKKLSETANFINLVRQAFKSNPKDTESLASSVALVHALNQQIGTLGAMFPQLGRLSDNDINILRTGLPTAKSLVLKRIFPKFSAEYYGGLENALVAGLAKRVEAHLANVTNPDEKHRLTTQYGLYTPGMEKYITRRKQ